MTTEPISEPVESSGDSPPPIEPSEPNPILGEITRLNQDEGTVDTTPDDGDSSEQAQPEQATPDQPVAEGTPAEGTPAEGAAPDGEAQQQQPQQPQYTPQQLQQLQFQAQQYQAQQAQDALANEAGQYRQQLENQGYLPEQAQQAAYEYMQSQQRQMDLMRQAEEYGQHLQGQMMAAEALVRKHNLGIEDLPKLRAFNDPRSMEAAAQKISADRERDAELARLRQAQVPAQQFDNSQGEPSVAQNDASWLDRYNSGDRSPNSVAAARRATGLE